MELHQLRYFLAVVDEGSFTAAATAMHVSQSGVSTQVLKLERELNVSLLLRTTRHCTLSDAGHRLIPAMRSAVTAVDQVHSLANELHGLVTGAVHVGIANGLTWQRAIDAVSETQATHPGIEVVLREDRSRLLLEDTASGNIDVAIAATAGAWCYPTLRHATIVREPLVAVVSTNHPWSQRRRVVARDLTTVDLIALEQGTGARDGLDAVLKKTGYEGRPRWEVSTPLTAYQLVQRTLGVAVVSTSTAQQWDSVHCIQIFDRLAHSQLDIAWREPATPAATAVLRAITPT